MLLCYLFFDIELESLLFINICLDWPIITIIGLVISVLLEKK